MQTSDLLTKIEAAGFLRISMRTLDRLIAERQILGARVGDRRLVFRRTDLEQFVYRRLQESAQ